MRRLLLALVAVLGAATAAPAAPAMWRVSDSDSHIWVFGSIHILGKTRDWRTPEFNDALAASELVYFEMLLNPSSTARMLRLSMIYGKNRDGRKLSDYLSPEQRESYFAFMEENGLDLAVYEPLRPWYAMLMMSQMLAGPDILPAIPVGVETVIEVETDDAKERGLETAETQFRVLSGGTDAEHVEALMAAIEGSDETSEEMTLDDMLETWLAGDVDGLETQLLAELGSRDTPMYRRFLTDRNRRWVDELSDVLDNNDEAMVIVGAAHLGGPHGVPALLAERGFTVERVQ